MTMIWVNAAEVAELGVALSETGAALLDMDDPSAERWALGPGEAAVAVRPFNFGIRARSTEARKPGVFTTGVMAFSSNPGVDAFLASLTKISGTCAASATA